MTELNQTYRIELQALPGLTEADAVLGLRALLKTALRCHGLRCTSATTTTPAATTTATQGHDRQQAVAEWAQQKYGPGWSLTQDWFALEAEFDKQQSTNTGASK